jgi:hypothetical protein
MGAAFPAHGIQIVTTRPLKRQDPERTGLDRTAGNGIADTSNPMEEGTGMSEQGATGGGGELPKAIQDYLASLSPEKRAALREIREKLTELKATDTVKAQVV